MKKYCHFVSFSFRKILERTNETTQTDEMIGAAIAPFPLIAKTYVNWPAVSRLILIQFSVHTVNSNRKAIFVRFPARGAL